VLDVEGDEETYLLGSREDSHDELEILSAESPMGQAVLDQPAGATVAFTTPTGVDVEVVIRAIRTV
jgi:transcription elongation factor GreA